MVGHADWLLCPTLPIPRNTEPDLFVADFELAIARHLRTTHRPFRAGHPSWVGTMLDPMLAMVVLKSTGYVTCSTEGGGDTILWSGSG